MSDIDEMMLAPKDGSTGGGMPDMGGMGGMM